MSDGTGPTPDFEAAPAVGFEHSAHLMIVVEGPDLVLVAINEVARSLIGDRTVGAPMRVSFADVIGQQVFEIFELCYVTGAAQRVWEWRFELDGPGGELVELLLDSTITPWIGADGAVRGVIAEGVDVSEQVRNRREAEAARDAAERELVEARTIALTMQEAHLPQALPVLPRLDVAARYLLAVDGTVAGGDWFDVVVRPGGRVALVVGDVVGHGVVASATMGQLGAVVHERLSSDAPLEQVLADVDRFARREPDARQATLCVVELDLTTGEGRYCTAGHPPPLVVDGADPSYLAPTGGAPLATSGALTLAPITLSAPDAVVVLYTDGLVERPGTTIAASTVELAEITANALHGHGPVRQGSQRATERVGRSVLELMTRTTGFTDDITVLVARRQTAPGDLSLRLPAEIDSLATAREAVLGWLRDLEVRDLDRVALSHATFELLANVVEHAYPVDGPPGELRLELRLDDAGRATVTVADRGRWRGDDRSRTVDQGTGMAGRGGRGLQLASAYLDTLEVHGDAAGTSAVGTLAVARAAHLMTGTAAEPGPTEPEERFTLVEDTDRLRVSGPLLPEAADELDLRLRGYTAGGTRRMVLDLTEVTHLGSAAVRVLHDQITTQGADIRLVAPRGSTAQHVLDLVGLPVETTTQPPQ